MKARRFIGALVAALWATNIGSLGARSLPDSSPLIDLAHFQGADAAWAIFEETNRRRVASGLPRLTPLAAAQTCAQWQVQYIAQTGALSHVNSSDRARRTLEARVRAAGVAFRFIAENVAMNFAIDYEARRPVYPRRGPSGERLFSYTGDGRPLLPHTYSSFARSVVSQWMNSAGHRRNLLSRESKYLGCAALPGARDQSGGLGNIYCAQVFITPR